MRTTSPLASAFPIAANMASTACSALPLPNPVLSATRPDDIRFIHGFRPDTTLSICQPASPGHPGTAAREALFFNAGNSF